MLVWMLLLASGVFLVLAASAVQVARPVQQSLPSGLRRFARRWQSARRAIIVPLGRPLAAVAVLFVGVGATVVVCWPLGRLARRLESAVDVPLFRFAERHHFPVWNSLNKSLTLIGNRPEIKIVCLLSAVVLTVLWRHRQWWVPVVVIGSAFFVEKFTQQVLGKVADRGHPPTTLGTYPSGGCARVIAIYGTILFLVLLTLPRVSRAINVLVWTSLGLAAFVEGYTRIYLLKHWFTDVLGGWLFGSLLLGVLVAATFTLVGAAPPAGAGPGADRTSRRHPASAGDGGHAAEAVPSTISTP